MRSTLKNWGKSIGDIFARLVFSLAMCGVMASILYATDGKSLGEMVAPAKSSGASPAIVISSKEDRDLCKSDTVADTRSAAMAVRSQAGCKKILR